jgi:Zn-dependent oligopeptidase
LNSWDRSFYTNILKEKFYSIDEEKIKEYFPTDNVVKVTMEIYQELLGLVFTQVENVQLWHEEASCYLVQDTKSGETLGHFYLDLYPRDNKFGHAAVFPLLKRAKIDGQVIPAAAAMLCNFDKPSETRPSLLPHGDVVTFFHEFGHVMHGMCSHANYSRFSGTSVERDFVELPSQMLENWVWDKSILKRVSKHFETGEPLPDETIDKKIGIKNLLEATFTLRQLFYGSFDFLLHSANDETLLNQEYDQGLFNIGTYRKEMKKDGLKVDTHDLWHKLTPAITLGNA